MTPKPWSFTGLYDITIYIQYKQKLINLIKIDIASKYYNNVNIYIKTINNTYNLKLSLKFYMELLRIHIL